ncbi:MAG: HD domain-containing phosphohydrolase, partial [Christensenellales bacterium]
SKIVIILVPIMLLAIIVINLIFSTFFSSYLEDQEKSEIITNQRNVYSYITKNIKKYKQSVNDWGHRDDTYGFVNGDNSGFMNLGLMKDTFVNFNASFAVILKNDNTVYYQKFYDFNRKSFIEFSANFFNDFEKVISDAKLKKGVSNIYELGNKFYFVASADITDSLLQKSPVGKLIIGRLIDYGIYQDIKGITDSDLVSIDTLSVDAGGQAIGQTDGFLPLPLVIGKDSIEFRCAVPDMINKDSMTVLSFVKPRTLYISGMVQFQKFVFVNIIEMLIITLILFSVLGVYISRPLVELIEDVKEIDLKQNIIKKIDVKGKDEFSFLRMIINDMLEEIEKEQNNVKDNEEKLYATLLSVGDGVIVTGVDNRIQFINQVAQKLTGWTQKEAIGKPFEDVFNIIHEFSREKVESPVKKAFETQTIVELSSHTMLISKDGTVRSIEDTAAPIKDKKEKVVGCVIVFRDFSEKKEKQKRIEYLSFHDQLTGLYNRRFFEDELRRIDTKENLPISLVYADVNGLKTINDAFGHQVGDQLIQKVADVFQAECDMHHIISRTGGDEFILILPKTDRFSTEKLVNRINDKIEQKNIMGIKISLSFGWDTKHSKDQPAWDVLKTAEDIMYQRKILSSSSMRSAVINSILNTLYIKWPIEDAHSKRVSLMCDEIGKAYNLSEDELKELRIAGELHDIGKIVIDKAILNKETKLSESEWAQIRSHPETGYRILGTSSEFYNIAEYVLAHHERWDGKGYPNGTAGETIPWKARVIAVADAYDAMTCKRPYRKALSEQQAIAEIKKSAGVQLDPEIAKVFIEKVLGGIW